MTKKKDTGNGVSNSDEFLEVVKRLKTKTPELDEIARRRQKEPPQEDHICPPPGEPVNLFN